MKYIKNNPNSKCTCANPDHHAIWDLEPDKILNSLTAVFKNQDITELTPEAYKFVMNMSGFIAHYDIHGFRSTYEDLRLFAQDLLLSSDTTDHKRYLNDEFFSKGEQPLYYKQKAEVLKAIPAIVNKYIEDINTTFYEKQKTEELSIANAILAKYN
jgi:hypothetical protein